MKEQCEPQADQFGGLRANVPDDEPEKLMAEGAAYFLKVQVALHEAAHLAAAIAVGAKLNPATEGPCAVIEVTGASPPIISGHMIFLTDLLPEDHLFVSLAPYAPRLNLQWDGRETDLKLGWNGHEGLFEPEHIPVIEERAERRAAEFVNDHIAVIERLAFVLLENLTLDDQTALKICDGELPLVFDRLFVRVVREMLPEMKWALSGRTR